MPTLPSQPHQLLSKFQELRTATSGLDGNCVMLPPHYNSQEPPSRATSGAAMLRLWVSLRPLAGLRLTRLSPPPFACPFPVSLGQCGGASIHTFPSCKSVSLGDVGCRERGHFARESRAPGFPTHFPPPLPHSFLVSFGLFCPPLSEFSDYTPRLGSGLHGPHGFCPLLARDPTSESARSQKSPSASWGRPSRLALGAPGLKPAPGPRCHLMAAARSLVSYFSRVFSWMKFMADI